MCGDVLHFPYQSCWIHLLPFTYDWCNYWIMVLLGLCLCVCQCECVHVCIFWCILSTHTHMIVKRQIWRQNVMVFHAMGSLSYTFEVLGCSENSSNRVFPEVCVCQDWTSTNLGVDIRNPLFDHFDQSWHRIHLGELNRRNRTYVLLVQTADF